MASWPAALGALIIGVGAGAGTMWYLDQESADQESAERTAVVTTTAVSETRDLISFEEWGGTLSSGATASVSASGRGTLTRTLESGDQIEVGDVIAEIDGQPVVALYGTVPQFRELEVNSTDGEDIRQLEENLVALGYDPDGTITVDENYTVNTGLMVERWEEDLGLEEPDTVVGAGQVAFIEGPSEITSRVAVGSQVVPGQPLLTTLTLAKSGYASASETYEDPGSARAATAIPDGAVEAADVLDQEGSVEVGRPIYRWEEAQGGIELAVEVDEADTFPIGAEVEVELPDGDVVDAEVTEIGDVARTIQSGQESVTVVDVTIQPVEPLNSSFSAGPVTIRIQDDAILGATMIPVRALIALQEGGHAVEVEGRGLVAVELGAFDDGWVEITNGAIQPDETLVVPA